MSGRLPFASPTDLASAVAAVHEVLASSCVVAAPTETFYGLSVAPFDGVAVGRVFELKGRPGDKSLPVIGASLGQLAEIVRFAPAWLERLARIWPAPLTVVVPVRRPLAAGRETLAVRVPDHALLRRLLERVGPLTSTSANPTGAAPPSTPEEVLAGLPGGIALLLDGGRTAGGAPSTLLDCTTEPAKLLRPGAFRTPREWGVKEA